MYPPDYRDDQEECGCTMGKACAWHAEREHEEREHDRAAARARGVNPDAEITGDLLEIMMRVELTPALSQSQKDHIAAIIFPLL